VAIVIAMLVGIGIDAVVDARGRGAAVLAMTTLVVQAGVAALMVTALDELRPVRRRLRHS
jgi:hypothetical protein